MRRYVHDPDRDRDYRKNELDHEVFALMEIVRNEHHKEVPIYAIDKAIKLQQERSILTACNFIRYFLLHELNYVDVFGQAAILYDRELQHYKQTENIEMKVDILTDMVNDMALQMGAMQEFIIKMAKIINKSEKAVSRSA